MKYFMFSRAQLEFQKKIFNNISSGKPFNNRYVFYNGKKFQYTEILDDPTKSKYPDAIMVASGNLNSMNYTK